MIKDKARKLKLDAPVSFWLTDEATLEMITGGCGPGRFGDHGWFDKIYLLSIKLACRIHDFEYSTGKTLEEKLIADNRFLRNMFKIINTQSKFEFIKILRRYRALSYYNMVSEFGEDAFEEATIV